MFNFLVTAEGGLTTAGYAVSVIAVLILIILVAVLLQKNTSALKFTTQQLVTCAVALALAYVTSYIKIFKLPFGGSVTLFSMLFIVLIGYWYGIKVGILTGLVYGIFQFLQEPYVLSFFQVCCDYILAFGAMGLSGLFNSFVSDYLQLQLYSSGRCTDDRSNFYSGSIPCTWANANNGNWWKPTICSHRKIINTDT